jgi:hypothetical protein
MNYDDYGLWDNPDPPPERESQEDKAHREEEMLDADDDRRWSSIEKSLDGALAAIRKRRIK